MRGYFFFQAEDGIRVRDVTGVQTCALPICSSRQATWVSRGASQPAGSHRVASFCAVGPVAVFQVAKIGRASCRERVEELVGGVAIQKKEDVDGWDYETLFWSGMDGVSMYID